MILGIGVDMVEIPRVQEAISRESFCKRVYTERELAMARQRGRQEVAFLAGNFASKEALSKAFGTGIAGFELSEVEVLRQENGRPYILLHGRAKAMFEKLGGRRIHISISNTEEHAISYVIMDDDERLE